MTESGVQTRERPYRKASQVFDYFVTGLSSLMFLSTALIFEAGQQRVVNTFDLAAIILFALASLAGLKKLEYYVAVLGTDYTIAMTEANQTGLTVRESTVVLQDLSHTVEQLSSRASIVHQLRNWFFLFGVLSVTVSRVFEYWLV